MRTAESIAISDEFSPEDMILHRESLLRAKTFEKRDAFRNADARRHFNEGFVRRHYMLQSSRLFLDEHCASDRKTPLSPYEATDCAIYLNAYYSNLRGALDNLAWVFQYEWQLLGELGEDQGRDRQKCYLFGRPFLAALKISHPDIAIALEEHRDWAVELAELRDPGAHRIPIYVPPSVITSQHQVEEFRRIEAQANLPESDRNGRSISDIYHEAQAVADFAPVMILSPRRGLEIRAISKQVGFDHDKYLTIGDLAVSAL
jgi:hypothetical protein